MAKRSAGRRPTNLGRVDLAVLHAELRRREKLVSRLRRKHASAMRRVATIEAQLDALGGKPTGRGRSLAVHNTTSLVDALAKVLSGKTMGIPEMADAVQKDGYRTSSPNFRVIINATLIKFKDRFRRVARGQYTVK